MGSHPANLFLRFLLEIIALISLGIWGWKQSETSFKFVLAFGIPIILAIIWGVFAVPDDPSRSGAAPIITPGFIRLFIELAIFSFAVWAQNDMGWKQLSLIFGIIILAHYIISYDRILWLFSK
nr:YrdB family protein [Lutibacter sp. Hel_I_33_5]